jgi:hypothetical protein
VGAFLVLAAARLATVSGPVAEHDRARWATTLALLERGDASLGHRMLLDHGYRDEGLITEPAWRSVDVVLDPSSLRFYASKPWPVSGIAAAVVRPVEWITGWRLRKETPQLVRWTLVVVNLLPFALYLLALRRWLRRRQVSLFAATLAMATAAASGWFAFLTALTGHSLAAACAGWLMLRLTEEHDDDQGDPALLPASRAVVDGLLAGAIAVLEAAGGLLAGALLASRLSKGRRYLFAPTLAAVAGVGIAFLVGNKLFTDAWLPAYVHAGSAWYDYQGSYWSAPAGIDLGEASASRYAWHALLGHHGLFSQAPLLLFGVLGAAGLSRWRHPALLLFGGLAGAVCLSAARKMLALPIGSVEVVLVVGVAWLVLRPHLDGMRDDARASRVSLATTLGALAFYLSHTKNYGGVTSYFRHVIWLGPMLWTFLPDGISRLDGHPRLRHIGRLAAMVGLLVSLRHATHVVDTPFVHPSGYLPAEDDPRARATRGTYRL